MTFLSPQWLWALLAAIPLVAVYFLKVRPRRRPVTAYFLWERILVQRKASSLFQRLRDALSLLLMLAALAAAVFAAASPRFRKADDRDIVVIVDASSSMRATRDGKPIVENARHELREWIKALNGTRRMAIGLAAADLSFLSHLSDNPGDLLDAVDRVVATDMPVAKSTIRAINSAAAASGGRTRFILLTDGARGWEGLAPEVEVVRHVPGPLPNAGIAAADLEWSGVAGDKARFFYQVSSSFPETRRVELELREQETDTLARLIPLTLEPGGTASATVDIEHATAGRWLARLSGSDALAADDTVALALPPRVPVNVAVPTKDAFFFQRCVESFQAATGALALNQSNPDITLCRGSVPDGVATAVVFAPSGKSPFWTGAGDAAAVLLPENVRPGHPALANLDFDALRFEGAKNITPAEGSMVLAVSESGLPLIWLATVGERRALVVNLDPEEGAFYLTPWFPVLVHNAATYLAGRATPLRAVLPTGSRFEAGNAIPPGGTQAIGPSPLLEAAGHWRTARGEWFGAAILSEPETVLDGKGPIATAKPIDRGYPPLVWFLLIAIVLLAAEMALYHRRKVG